MLQNHLLSRFVVLAAVERWTVLAALHLFVLELEIPSERVAGRPRKMCNSALVKRNEIGLLCTCPSLPPEYYFRSLKTPTF